MAIIILLSLALGIGATTAVFSVLYAALINPYPYPGAERIVRFSAETKNGERDTLNLNGLQLRQLERVPVVQSVLAMDFRAMKLTGHEFPENVRVVPLIATGFRDLGVPVLMGRGLEPSDAPDGQEPAAVIVLSYKYWRTHFLSDPNILGKQIELDHVKYLIVGIAAPRFTWYNPDAWTPLKVDNDPARRLMIDIILKPGIRYGEANAALQPLVDQFSHDNPNQFYQHLKVRVEGLNEWVTRSISGTLTLLFGAVLLLLAIGCGNVSILLLAHGAARQHEFSVRAAIGAGRGRLFGQLLTESLLLAIVGAGLGILLSYGILAGIKAVLPRYAFAPEVVVTVNLPVLFFSAGLGLLTLVLFGLWPAFQLSRSEIGQNMQLTVRRIAGSIASRRTHQGLIAGQIALTLLLLTGAGAATQGFLRILSAPLGYDPHNVITVPIPLPENSYTTWAARSAYFQQLQDTLAQVPAVEQTAISTNATPPHNGWSVRFEIAGKPAAEAVTVPLNLVSERYFPLLRIALLEGRLWSAAENVNCAHVVVVNHAFAERYFPEGRAIGSSLKLPRLEDRPPLEVAAPQITNSWLEIIGIVANARDDGLRDPVKPAIYTPDSIDMGQFTQILIRSAIPPAGLEYAVRKQLAKLNSDQQVFEIEDLDAVIRDGDEWQQEHLSAWVFDVFALLALALAAVGLFSVVSYAVAQRTGELGIRMALGAQPAHVLRAVFASTLLSVGSGVAVGVILSLSLGGVLERWAGGTSRDPLTLAGGVLVLAVAASIACLIPARHAIRIDPMSALRFE